MEGHHLIPRGDLPVYPDSPPYVMLCLKCPTGKLNGTRGKAGMEGGKGGNLVTYMTSRPLTDAINHVCYNEILQIVFCSHLVITYPVSIMPIIAVWK